MTALLEAHVYKAPTIPRCATPACRHKAGAGVWGVFCNPCAVNLARIREELEEASGARCVSFNNGRKTVQEGPRCCNPYCQAPRTPPAAFCDGCVDAGYVEEEAA